jgi:DNA-directed RNA polymerase subunit H (RpoH/RPB5)
MNVYQSSSEDAIIEKSKKNLFILLQKRNSFNDIKQYSDIVYNNIDKFKKSKSNNDIITKYISNNNTKLCIIELLYNPLRENTINDIIETLVNTQIDDESFNKNDEIIIITNDKPNASAQKVLKELYATDNPFITVIPIISLQFNILDHDLVPEHTIISNEEEKQKIYSELMIQNDRQLPEISRFDPVAIAIGLRPYQLCKIIRKSKTTINSVYYRICV